VADPILVLRLSSLGDVVLTSSFLQSLDDHFPGAPVTYVVREDLGMVAAALPGVQRLVAVPRGLGAAGLLDLGRQLRRDGYAHAFDLHRSLRTRWIGAALRERLRPGFHKQELARFVCCERIAMCAHLRGARLGCASAISKPLVRMACRRACRDTRLVHRLRRASARAAIWRQAGYGADERRRHRARTRWPASAGRSIASRRWRDVCARRPASSWSAAPPAYRRRSWRRQAGLDVRPARFSGPPRCSSAVGCW
jgi:hypothetical protein